jgi:hypothetical protein
MKETTSPASEIVAIAPAGNDISPFEVYVGITAANANWP